MSKQLNHLSLSERLLNAIHITESGCWEWTRARSKDGYGQIRIDKTLHYAHRLALSVLAGINVPADKYACHRCDNPPCINPAHLFVGTNGDNMLDAITKGRKTYENPPRGSEIATAKVTEQHVVEIRALADRGVPQRALGRQFGVTHNAIGAIVRRETWKHIS